MEAAGRAETAGPAVRAVPAPVTRPVRRTKLTGKPVALCAGATRLARLYLACRGTIAFPRNPIHAVPRTRTAPIRPTSWEADRCAVKTPAAPGSIARRETTAPTRRRGSADHRKTERTNPTSREADRCAVATPAAPACTVDPAARASTPGSSCVVSLPVLRQNHSGTATPAGLEPVRAASTTTVARRGLAENVEAFPEVRTPSAAEPNRPVSRAAAGNSERT